MEKKLFNELVQSLKETKAIARGEVNASRRFVADLSDVKAIRDHSGLSQSDFAKLTGVSVRTLKNWEQHRRSPSGPAAALLKIVSASPEAALKSLHS